MQLLSIMDFSFGNLLTIVTIVIAFATTWGAYVTHVKNLDKKIDAITTELKELIVKVENLNMEGSVTSRLGITHLQMQVDQTVVKLERLERIAIRLETVTSDISAIRIRLDEIATKEGC